MRNIDYLSQYSHFLDSPRTSNFVMSYYWPYIAGLYKSYPIRIEINLSFPDEQYTEFLLKVKMKRKCKIPFYLGWNFPLELTEIKMFDSLYIRMGWLVFEPNLTPFSSEKTSLEDTNDVRKKIDVLINIAQKIDNGQIYVEETIPAVKKEFIRYALSLGSVVMVICLVFYWFIFCY